MWLRRRQRVLVLACVVGLGVLPSAAAAADLVRLARILAPVLTAEQFAGVCRAADPAFKVLRGPLGSVHSYSAHMRDEVLAGLGQDEASIVLLSAADRARSTALGELRALASSSHGAEVQAAALAAWCAKSALAYIERVMNEHDNDHSTYEAVVESAKHSP